MYNHLMIDMETLSVRPNGVILSIGAVYFDPQLGIDQHQGSSYFYQRVNIMSCLNEGLKIDKSTWDWWKRQDQVARAEALYARPRYPLKAVLKSLGQFSQRAECVWSHGATFDISRLEVLYDRFSIELPWCYRHPRDTRTLAMLTPELEWARPEIKHHALSDAIAQARTIHSCLTILAKHGLYITH